MKLLSQILCLIAVFSSTGCNTVPEPLPVAKQTEWLFDADVETGHAAKIALNDSVATVIEMLGTPAKRQPFAADPAVEVLRYSRSVIGPRRMRYLRSTGSQVADNLRYEDKIAVYVKEGVVVSVTFERGEKEPAGFGRPAG